MLQEPGKPATPIKAPPRRRGRLRLLLEGLGLLLVGVCTMVFFGLVKARGQPAWWAALRPPAEGRGERVENALLSELTRVRPLHADVDDLLLVSDAWTLAMSDQDIRAWLAQRLPAWIENQELDDAPAASQLHRLSRVAMRSEGSTLVVGVEVRDAGVEKTTRDTRVLWARVTPTIRPDGSLWLAADRVGIGSLGLPAGVLSPTWSGQGALVPDSLAHDPAFAQLLRVLRGEQPAMRLAALRLDGGRRVRILGIAPGRDGEVVLTLRTEAARREGP